MRETGSKREGEQLDSLQLTFELRAELSLRRLYCMEQINTEPALNIKGVKAENQHVVCLSSA